MNSKDRLVIGGPLKEIWDSQGVLSSTKLRIVGREAIRMMLQISPVRFVVANCGDVLRWISPHESFEFWKHEVKAHLVEPQDAESRFRLEDFPGKCCYIASEWSGQQPVILLETYH